MAGWGVPWHAVPFWDSVYTLAPLSLQQVCWGLTHFFLRSQGKPSEPCSLELSSGTFPLQGAWCQAGNSHSNLI